jgi:hypothetical protein
MRHLFVFLILFLAVTVGNAALAEEVNSVREDLSSTEGLMRLIPQLRNAKGQFEIPNPGTNLQNFLRAYQSLIEVIETALVQANEKRDPYSISKETQVRLSFAPNWRSAEIGVMTDGKVVSFPGKGHFASYGGESFLKGIIPMEGTANTFYQVSKPDGSVPAIICAEPTALPCVNRLVLAAANTAGIWMYPSYALGTKDGKAFLIVDKCIDLGVAKTRNGTRQLMPSAELFTAIQWLDTPDLSHMRTTEKGHQH